MLGQWKDATPWTLTSRANVIVVEVIARLRSGYRVEGSIAVHETAVVEPGAILKGPLIIGPNCFIAAGAYLRGGCWLAERCIVGPGAELKSSFLFEGTKLAHFNFVGDSILGEGVNLEAGSIVANYRNEQADPAIAIVFDGRRIDTGVSKFGAIIGDFARIGANSVVAPGAFIAPRTIVPRLSLVDQAPR